MTKEERVIEVDAATMEIFLSTYSADRITEPKGARLKGVVDFEGKLYTLSLIHISEPTRPY